MNKIKLDKSVVSVAMIFDKKPLERRLTKMTEEYGELGEAIILNDGHEITEEAIDVLLVALSIYIDLGGTIQGMEDLVNKVASNPDDTSEDIYYLMKYIKIGYLKGKFAEELQKYSGVATSVYKGSSTKEDLFNVIVDIVTEVTQFIVTREKVDVINSVINKKNGKWKKNAMKGFVLSNQNQYIEKSDKEFVDNFISFSKELSEDYSLYVQAMNYNHIEGRLSDGDFLEDVMVESPNDKLRDIVIIYNVPLKKVDKIMESRLSFKVICIS